MVKNNQSGQAITEYILLIAMVSFLFLALLKGLDRMNVAGLLTQPITKNFAAVYRYGHPEAKGFDDGGPQNHPRATEGEGSFRIFLNPDGGG